MDSYLNRRTWDHVTSVLLICSALSSPATWADADADSHADSNARAIVSSPIVIEGPEGGSTQATGVNGRGAVVGVRITQSGFGRAFVWTRQRGLEDLETSQDVEFPSSIAFAINECGVIVGESMLPGALGSRAVRWMNGEIDDLGTLGGSFSVANDVNERGQVVGDSLTAGDAVRAFLWTEEQGMIDLGTLGGDFSVADGINNRGEVVGSSTTAAGEEHAYIWSRRTGMVDLGTQGLESSRAFAINDQGEVALAAFGDLGNIARGFKWTRKRGFVELKARLDFAFPMAINHEGLIAGTTKNQNGNRRAALWPQPRGVLSIAPELGETDSDATAISDGWVAGTLLFDGGETQRAVVWRLRAGGPDRHKLKRFCRHAAG